MNFISHSSRYFSTVPAHFPWFLKVYSSFDDEKNSDDNIFIPCLAQSVAMLVVSKLHESSGPPPWLPFFFTPCPLSQIVLKFAKLQTPRQKKKNIDIKERPGPGTKLRNKKWGDTQSQVTVEPFVTPYLFLSLVCPVPVQEKGDRALVFCIESGAILPLLTFFSSLKVQWVLRRTYTRKYTLHSQIRQTDNSFLPFVIE